MGHDDFELNISIRRPQVVVFMTSVVLLLTLLNLAANIMWIEHWPGSGMALAIFSADREMTWPTW